MNRITSLARRLLLEWRTLLCGRSALREFRFAKYKVAHDTAAPALRDRLLRQIAPAARHVRWQPGIPG